MWTFCRLRVARDAACRLCSWFLAENPDPGGLSWWNRCFVLLIGVCQCQFSKFRQWHIPAGHRSETINAAQAFGAGESQTSGAGWGAGKAALSPFCWSGIMPAWKLLGTRKVGCACRWKWQLKCPYLSCKKASVSQEFAAEFLYMCAPMHKYLCACCISVCMCVRSYVCLRIQIISNVYFLL